MTLAGVLYQTPASFHPPLLQVGQQPALLHLSVIGWLRQAASVPPTLPSLGIDFNLDHCGSNLLLGTSLMRAAFWPKHTTRSDDVGPCLLGQACR